MSNPSPDRGMRTAYLDQYTDENAAEIIDALDGAGIRHWEKRSGAFIRFLSAMDWGTRIFVDEARLDEARRIADGVLGGD